MNAPDSNIEIPTSRRILSSLAHRSVVPWLVVGATSLVAHVEVHVECPFRQVTGWDCPACGGTRALSNLFHGRVIDAVHDNALAMLIGVVVLVGFIPGIRGSRLSRSIQSLVSDRSPLIWVGLLVIWTLLRNLPALNWLGPDR